ncbi:ATP-binding cassette domain-containing protein [Williamsoniiplasma lucivorax]|uniref:ABC transporter ATP-binding protein n=1 Tax=Williamsoniiplasma lucivorax TaxID=209274 RepID=A0A2S5RFY5_9MOLU|nr:ATP-binding cassette domain-containing protein [Williamsoniiplasma lucivorax]PPE06122.1 ABC transporter ATP-binding protein [Williamsoniiplasma lucivorax]
MEIKVTNLTKKIKNKKILIDVNAIFKPGKHYGLLGNNGVGKTTLLKCIFNEYDYESGTITFDNQKMNEKNLSQIYYFPDNNDLQKHLSIYNLLRTQYLFNKQTLKGFEKKLNEENIYFLQKNLKKTLISSLSSGQQKLVSLLACKILNPKIIFFDEPTANLDLSNKQMIIDEIKKIANSDKTIIIITHLVEEFSNFFNEIIIIDQGTVKFQGPAKPNVKQQFLEAINYKGEVYE